MHVTTMPTGAVESLITIVTGRAVYASTGVVREKTLSLTVWKYFYSEKNINATKIVCLHSCRLVSC